MLQEIKEMKKEIRELRYHLALIRKFDELIAAVKKTNNLAPARHN